MQLSWMQIGRGVQVSWFSWVAWMIAAKVLCLLGGVPIDLVMCLLQVSHASALTLVLGCCDVLESYDSVKDVWTVVKCGHSASLWICSVPCVVGAPHSLLDRVARWACPLLFWLNSVADASNVSGVRLMCLWLAFAAAWAVFAAFGEAERRSRILYVPIVHSVGAYGGIAG
jgi:hypothetical protein